MQQHANQASFSTLPSYTINLFFVLGLCSAVAFRILIVIVQLKEDLFRPIWYLGTMGYILFFLYRYFISQKRKKAIDQYGLIPKLQSRRSLTDQDRQAVIYLLSSIKKSREHLNYLFIFVLSVLAIITDIWINSI